MTKPLTNAGGADHPSSPRLLQWHWGKILMLWIVVPALGFGGTISLAAFDFTADAFLFFPLAVSIVVMLVITWVWLTGKESR